MANDLVSVIVPVYGVEQYLPQCVDSLLAQTYENIEIILVDDGSPDGCGAICDAYAARDPRVTALHKENGGLSDARNFGLRHAHGNLISFVDSDDWVSPVFIEALQCAMGRFETRLATVSYGHYFHDGDEVHLLDDMSAVAPVREVRAGGGPLPRGAPLRGSGVDVQVRPSFRRRCRRGLSRPVRVSPASDEHHPTGVQL